MTDDAKRTAQADTYGEASSSSGTSTYACDGCGGQMEVTTACISIAGGELYCDECGGPPVTDGGRDDYCGAETTADGETVECERAPGHDGDHAGHIPSDTPGLTWDRHDWGEDVEWCGSDDCPVCQGHDEPPEFADDPVSCDEVDDYPPEADLIPSETKSYGYGTKPDDPVPCPAAFDVENIRHVSTDRGAIHLVATEDADFSLCGDRVGGLRAFGDPVDTPEEAAKLGVWVNVREEICPGCREAFNSQMFELIDCMS